MTCKERIWPIFGATYENCLSIASLFIPKTLRKTFAGSNFGMSDTFFHWPHPKKEADNGQKVEDYPAFCAERGEQPKKSFSGNLPLRIEPDLHRKIYVKARQEGKSLNRWISDVLKHELG